MSRHTDTIAALATPHGTAALAIVRISGPDTMRIAAELTGGKAPSPRLARHIDYRDRAGTPIDDAMLTCYAAPRSYTGEDALEITCHGNPFIAQKILEDLMARGCRAAGPGEFTQRAFLNGRMDLSQAEGVMDLIHARSERALAAAQAQLRGALGRRMNALVDALLEVLARIEAYIDFPEEDLPPEDQAAALAKLDWIAREANRLLATGHYGELLREGIKTAIVGAPNVGKSSLLNRLVGQDRAIVSPEPGTTRDFIEERIMLGKNWLRLIDTAGINPSPALLEKLGMEKTLEWLNRADVVIVVQDASRPEDPLAPPIAAALASGKAILVKNKCDLVPSHKRQNGSGIGGTQVHVSALTGAGMDDLVSVIEQRVEAFGVSVDGDAIAVNARHARALAEARQGLADAAGKLSAGEPAELVASDLRGVLSAFGEIVGRVDNERMLDQLFASFCIGK